MTPRARISLGPQASVAWLPERRIESREKKQADPAKLVERVLAALPSGSAVHVTGSQRIGCALPTSDIDLVAVFQSLSAEDVLQRLSSALGVEMRLVQGARVPGIELSWRGVEVDLTLVDSGDIAPQEAVARRLELREPLAIALSAVSDADTLVDVMTRAGKLDAFLELARQVKAWAYVKGLGSFAYGGLPGLAWLVMTAHTVLSREASLTAFFAQWAEWDWRSVIAIGDVAGVTANTVFTGIMTPSAPYRSMTSGLSSQLIATLTEELFDAWEASQGTVERNTNLYALPALHRRHAAWLVITAAVAPSSSLAASIGWVRGRALALLTALDAAGIAGARMWPRPFEVSGSYAKLAVGLGREPDASAVLRVAKTWANPLLGVSVEVLENSAVPSLA